MSQKCRIVYLVLNCKSIERTAIFYRLLGMVFTEEKHGKSPRHYSTVMDNGTVLELYPDTGEEGGLRRFGIAVPNLAEAIKTLEGSGYTKQDAPSDAILFRDPDGRIIQLS